jgi:non-specific protein-tyrosine kinase
LLAAVVGAMLAVGVAFLVEYLDDTIKTPDDVSRVSGLSTLGAIARSREAAEGPGRQLIARLHSKAPEAEAYRTLRTNIQFCSVDKPVRTLLVTSAMPTEGKSTTAANLAVVMAQTGQRVVLVDTDLRRPVMHKVFGVPNNTGLTTALLAGEKVSLDGQLQPTEVENLSLLTSGPIPPNPSELLGSQRMAHLVEQLSDEADLVIFDSPPVLAVTDAAVLGRQVDGVLLVVDAGETREPALAQATAELQKTGATVLGAALNKLDTRRGGYYYYYYYYYYYTDEEGQRKRARSGRGNGGLEAPGSAKIRWPWRRKAAANVARSAQTDGPRETGHSAAD